MLAQPLQRKLRINQPRMPKSFKSKHKKPQRLHQRIKNHQRMKKRQVISLTVSFRTKFKQGRSKRPK